MNSDPTTSSLPGNFSRQCLERNLEALAVHQPKMVQRISWPVDGSHILFQEGGLVLYRLNSSTFPLTLSAAQAWAVMDFVGDGDLFVFGIGLGEQIDFLLDRFPEKRITAWDKDPWLLRLFLMQNDYSACLASGMLRLSLGTDLIRHAGSSAGLTPVYHPFLKNIYDNEADLLVSGIKDKRVILNTGGLFVDDVASVFRNLGFTPFCLNLGGISLEEIDYSITQFMPRILFSINYRNGLSELASRFNLILLCWEIDHAVDTLSPLTGRNDKAFIFTYRKKNATEFADAGFSHVQFLPMATNPEIRKPVRLSETEQGKYFSPVSFVGNILSAQARTYRKTLSHLYHEYCAACSIPVDSEEDPFEETLRRQAQDYTRYLLPECFHERFAGFTEYFQQRTGTTIDPVKLLAETAAAEKRLLYVSTIAGFGVKVWGDEGWKQIHGRGIEYMGAAGHRHELNKIYAGSSINLEINRLYQMDTVNMRIFDILACGAFVLAEYSQDLSDLLEPGKEIACYRTLDELEEKVGHYLTHPAEAREIALRGMAAVKEQHTIRHRVEAMLQSINDPVLK